MDYEARARELVLAAQTGLQPLWNLAEGDAAGTAPDGINTAPSDLARHREQYVTASGFWAAEAMQVLNNAPSGPYVDHLGAWYNTIVRQRSKLIESGWGSESPAGTFFRTLPGEIENQAGSMFKVGAGLGVAALVLIVAVILVK